MNLAEYRIRKNYTPPDLLRDQGKQTNDKRIYEIKEEECKKKFAESCFAADQSIDDKPYAFTMGDIEVEVGGDYKSFVIMYFPNTQTGACIAQNGDVYMQP